GTSARLDGLHRAIDRSHHIGVLRHLWQRLYARPSPLAQHLAAPRVDRVDAPREAGLAQELQWPPSRLGGVIRLADHDDGARKEQDVTQPCVLPSPNRGWLLWLITPPPWRAVPVDRNGQRKTPPRGGSSEFWRGRHRTARPGR